MKRSEALRILWEAINELEDADHILTRLEKAGMLPPVRTVTVHVFDYEELSRNIYEWEPENE